MQQMFKNLDWKYVTARMRRNEKGFTHNRIMAYVGKYYPDLQGEMICLIGADQAGSNPKTALTYNLSIDPDSFEYKGRSLSELTPQDHCELIQQGRSDPNGIYRVIQTHKNPRLLDAEIGFANGYNKGIDHRTLQMRAAKVHNQAFIRTAMQGLRLAYPHLAGGDDLLLPQPEEELFRFSALELYDPEGDETLEVGTPDSYMQMAVQSSRKWHFTANAAWRAAMEPHKDILLFDYPSGSDEEKMAVEAYLKRLEDIDKKLKINKAPRLPKLDVNHPVVDKQSAWRHHIKVIMTARELYRTGALKDLDHHYWFEDHLGHKVDEQEIKTWGAERFDLALRNDDLNIRHQTLNVTIPIIDRILHELKLAEHLLSPEALEQLDAGIQLKQGGIPFLLEGNQRWYTAPQAVRDLQKIKQNELADDDIKKLGDRYPGLYEKLIGGHPDALRALQAYEHTYLKPLLDKLQPLNEYQKALLGIDVQADYPVPNAQYILRPDNVETIMAPDRYLEQPVFHPDTGKPVWIVPLSDQFNALSEGKSKKDLVLTGALTGKSYHIPKPVFFKNYRNKLALLVPPLLR